MYAYFFFFHHHPLMLQRITGGDPFLVKLAPLCVMIVVLHFVVFTLCGFENHANFLLIENEVSEFVFLTAVAGWQYLF